jgi:hypothetical protein
MRSEVCCENVGKASPPGDVNARRHEFGRIALHHGSLIDTQTGVGSMEWLEFKGWSQDVRERLTLQAARLHEVSQHLPQTQVTATQAYHLQSMLRRYPLTNPWGHPTAEC